MAGGKPETVLLLDLDGVVFERVPVQAGVFSVITRRLFRKPLYDISQYYGPVQRQLDWYLLHQEELLSHWLHSRRNVKKGVRQALQVVSESEESDIIGNTGRRFKAEWVEMTEETLRQGLVLDYFHNSTKRKEPIFYTPKGVSTIQSKLDVTNWALERYTRVIVADDNPDTTVAVAANFPRVEVLAVQDWTTKLMLTRNVLRQNPTIEVVPSLPVGLAKKFRHLFK